MGGFNILRQEQDGQIIQLNRELIVAAKSGQSMGFAYEYNFADTSSADAVYWLKVHRLDGMSEQLRLGSVGDTTLLYLPLIR